MIRRIVFNFSKKTRYDNVPKILKDPRYTREGI